MVMHLVPLETEDLKEEEDEYMRYPNYMIKEAIKKTSQIFGYIYVYTATGCVTVLSFCCKGFIIPTQYFAVGI